MKLMTILSTTALAVLLGISATVFAQDTRIRRKRKKQSRTRAPSKRSRKTNRSKRTKRKSKSTKTKKTNRRCRNRNQTLVRMRNRISGPMPNKAGAFLRTVSGPISAGRTRLPLGIRLSWRELRVSSMAAIGL